MDAALWQSSSDNMFFTNIPGATNLNYQPGALIETIYYRQMQNATGVCGGPLATNTVTLSVSPAMVISDVIVDDVNCNGGNDGAISMVVSGSAPPYAYVWSNGNTSQNITQLSAGNYSVTTTSVSGCFTVGTWDVEQPLPISLSHTISADCNDVSIDLTVSGGTAPYSFLWNYMGKTTEDLTGLPPGIYTVIVTDAHGCTGTITIEVSANCCPDFSLEDAVHICPPVSAICCDETTSSYSSTLRCDTMTACKNTAHTYTVFPNKPGYTYTWTITGGTPSTFAGNPCTIDWGSDSRGFIKVIIQGTGNFACCKDSIMRIRSINEGNSFTKRNGGMPSI